MAEETKAAAPAVPAAPAAVEPTVIKLSKPVVFGQQNIESVTIREPTGADIVAYGSPVKINFNARPMPEVTFDEPKMELMMSALCLLPPSVLKKMSPRDWNTVAWQVAAFFIPDMAQL